MAIQDASVPPSPEPPEAPGPGVVAPAELAANNAATGIDRGEQQAALFAQHVARVQHGGAFVEPPDLGTPPPGPQPRRDRLRGAKVMGGRVLGVVGSGFFHGVTSILGRNTNDRVWTNWYRSGEHLPEPASKWAKILKLAHMRETLFANNLVRPYPDGAKTALRRPPAPPCLRSPGAGAPPTAAGTTCPPATRRAVRPDGRARRTRGSSATSGDDKGLRGSASAGEPRDRPGERARAEPSAVGRRGPAGRGAVPQPVGRRRGSSSEPRLDQPRHPTSTGTTDRSRWPRTTRSAQYGIDHLDGPAHAGRPDPSAATTARPPAARSSTRSRTGGTARRSTAATGRRSTRLRSHVGGKLTRHDDDGSLPVDPETGTERTGFVAELVGRRSGDAAHAVRARAQRDLRHARGRPTPTGTTRRCSRPPG